MEVDDTCLVARRDRLHWGILQEPREADFRQGASIKDPAGMFNSSLGGNTRRAIDIHQSDKINESAFKEIIRSAVILNLAAKKKK
jgi:hypothetical protein